MASSPEQLEEFLRTNTSIRYIRIQWLDYSGVLRARFVPVARCRLIASGSQRVCLAQNSMLIPISTAPKIFSLSDYHETWFLRPDWSSLRVCGHQAHHATVMSFVDQQDSKTRFDKCPRMFLGQTLKDLEEKWDAKIFIGFEIEFVLLDGAENLVAPMDRLNGYSRTAGLRGETLKLVEEVLDALEKSNIKVHHFHVEAFDQLEISLAYEPAMQAVDSLVLAQETIRAICVRWNLKASMTPRPILSGPLNGLHLHLSVEGLAKASKDNFVAGILTHMGSLCAFGMANYDGYVRSVNDAAGAWIGIGTDNRDLPVRRIDDGHWEFRMMDSTANPHLFVAAVLVAALHGLEQRTDLSWKDCKFFPAFMDEKRRLEYGMDKGMPVSLKDALQDLKSNESLKALLPEDLLKWFLSVKDKEVEEFGKMNDEQRRHRFLEYF